MGRPRKVPSKDNLTEKQLAIYNYIKECVQIRNYPPSVRDICTEVGLKSTSSVFSYLNDLEQAGLIRKDPSHPRAIEILDKSHSGKASKSSKTKELSPVHSSPVEESMKEMVSVPVIGTVAAGTPIFAEENVSDHFPLPTEILPNQETFILKVKGDSMINVGIFDGDYLMVAKQNTCSDGEVVVALVEDSATVKRFYKEKGYIRLQPENDTMEDIIVNDCQILGKAIGLIRVGL
ncbi:transcriptional repressor LexA [Oribacterium sinus]|jgi:repressor lexA|uniref:LexA repressor n=2 Tax=Oribacterium sinus TaxID=237576 RepID=A0A930DJH5_9FIRM|nr:transcriptional repressor LexA [Oribacterium sinus]MBF1272284.1 transcriptional repressor LexA [Oribacterium sinus]